MNRLLLFFLFLVISFTASAQRVYFIYLQSEGEQPFFVKMNEKVLSSTASGYLIMPKLVDSTYTFRIGFPQNKWPEQKFTVVLKAKDRGYLIKDFGEKGWGLFDLQTMAIQMGITESPRSSSGKMEKRDITAFTEILARAADDSTLLERPVAVAAAPKEETKPAVTGKKEETKTVAVETVNSVKEETSPANKEPLSAPKNETAIAAAIPVTPEVKDKNIVATEKKEVKPDKTGDEKPAEAAYKPTVITHSPASATEEGMNIVFIDEYANGVKDTIRIIIPNAQPAAVPAKEQVKEEKKFLDIESEVDSNKPVNPAIVPGTATTEAVTVKKNNCKEVATDVDFLKLRKKMAAETDDDDMVDEARKYFKTKCFTTLQMKNLGAMFLDDLGKYKFFSMSYIFVADIDNFPSLQSELKSDYYITRFKEILK